MRYSVSVFLFAFQKSYARVRLVYNVWILSIHVQWFAIFFVIVRQSRNKAAIKVRLLFGSDSTGREYFRVHEDELKLIRSFWVQVFGQHFVLGKSHFAQHIRDTSCRRGIFRLVRFDWVLVFVRHLVCRKIPLVCDDILPDCLAFNGFNLKI